jgi:hypothetical protein
MDIFHGPQVPKQYETMFEKAILNIMEESKWAMEIIGEYDKLTNFDLITGNIRIRVERIKQ